MAQLNQTGKYYKIYSHSSAEIFGLQGYSEGEHWYIGVYISGGARRPIYTLHGISPIPARGEVLAVIEQDNRNGNLHKIARVLLSSRMALRLILDGTITPSDFADAVEGEYDTSSSLGLKTYPAIKLTGVQFGTHKFPVTIISEINVGPAMLATIDANHEIV